MELMVIIFNTYYSLNILYLLKYNMRIFAFLMVTTCTKLGNKLGNKILMYDIKNTTNFVGDINNPGNFFLSNNLVKKTQRETAMVFNKYKNNDINRCYYCYGTGYTSCLKCYGPSCFKCDNTGYEECKYCGGSGRGGPRMMPIRDFIPN